MKELVIASNNLNKLQEIIYFLNPLGINVSPQSVFNITEADEPYSTFIENALAKARHASKGTGLPALADDSGICVNILDDKPGIFSARYAGEPKSDERNNCKLVEMLRNELDRRAYYYCIMVLVRYAEDPRPIISEGVWHGEIILEPRGKGGFGYDPYFYLPEIGKTAAELSMECKNKISHRSQALIRLVDCIKNDRSNGVV